MLNKTIFLSLHKNLIPKTYYTNKNEYDDNILIYYLNDIVLNYMIKNDHILITSQNNIACHLIRLIIKKNNFRTINNKLSLDYHCCIEFLMCFTELMEIVYMDYCTICGIQLDVTGLDTILHCQNIICQKEFYHNVTDNRVITKYNEDPKLFIFLVNILINGSEHPKGDLGYNPMPYISNVSSIAELKSLISKEMIIINNLETILQSATDDFQLIKNTNLNVYAILKNAVSNNYFLMSSKEDLPLTYDALSIINISYTADIENSFTGKHFLFHGSPFYCWYSIIKNGLKIMSGSSLQANGSLYGDGVYFSNNFNLSLKYANYHYKKTAIVGVFEIIHNPIKYKRATEIYVINDEKILLLRNLILIDTSLKIFANLNYFYQNTFSDIITIKNKRFKNIKNKRLENEFALLSINTKIYNLSVILEEIKWKITFKRINNNVFIIEIIFSNYPINPPVINLVNQKIERLCDSKNNILIPVLNPTEWNPTKKLTEIIDNVYNCLVEV